MLEALLSDSIKWKRDPDFDYEIVDCDAPENAELVGKVPAEILEPRRFYETRGRTDEYRAWVDGMKSGRREFLSKFNVAEPIIHATCD